MSGAESHSMDREMEGVLNRLELPMALVDLGDFTVVAASSALRNLLGLSETEVIGRRVTELYTPEDGAAAILALSVLRDGVVDFYRSERQLDPRFERAANVTAWGRSVTLDNRHFALVELSGGSARTGSPFAEYFGREPPVMALGAADGDWVISSMSSDSVALLGVAPEELVGQNLLSLVAPEDAPGLVAAEQMVNEDMSAAAKSVRMRDKDGAWRTLCCVLTELSVSNNRYFMLIPVDEAAAAAAGAAGAAAAAAVGAASGPGASTAVTPSAGQASESSSGGLASRVAELERHLWRIAAEVEASGVLRQVREGPDLSSLRELGSLSAKQWEVLSRLLQGKRVRSIAREMFVSESTVRNHLSAIFERFGVHSQAELLALLREPDQGGHLAGSSSEAPPSAPSAPASPEPPST
jgi:DNA-binding NarL/FixJ family response regulator/PAS domain-containing protein